MNPEKKVDLIRAAKEIQAEGAKHAGHADSAQTAEYFQRVNLIDDPPDVGL